MVWPIKRQLEMSGIDLIVDTNLLINLAEGKLGADHYLYGNKLFVSVITEIELLGWYKITNGQKQFFSDLLNDCKIVELMPDIKKISIELKQTKNKATRRCYCSNSNLSGYSTANLRYRF